MSGWSAVGGLTRNPHSYQEVRVARHRFRAAMSLRWRLLPWALKPMVLLYVPRL